MSKLCMVCGDKVNETLIYNGQLIGLCSNCLEICSKDQSGKRMVMTLEKVEPKGLLGFNTMCLGLNSLFGDNSPLFKIVSTKNINIRRHFISEKEADAYSVFKNLDIIYIRSEIWQQ